MLNFHCFNVASLFFILNTFPFRYGSTITNQIKRLGASCDWTRECFTLDDQLSRKCQLSFSIANDDWTCVSWHYLAELLACF